MDSLRNFLSKLEMEGNLKTVENASTEFEIAHYLRKFDGGPAVLFKPVKGFQNPVVGGILTSKGRVAASIEVSEKSLHQRILYALNNPTSPRIVNWMDEDRVISKPNLNQIPVLRHFEKDGGKYITAGIVVAKTPEGEENASFHRMMVLDKRHLAIRIVPRHLFKICEEARKRGSLELPVAVAIGLHPAILLAAASPAPYNVSEFKVANTLSKDGVKLSLTRRYGIPVPTEAEIVLEGKILLSKLVDEGPFVDLTGTYDVRRKQPVLEIEEMNCRKGFIYQALLPSGSEHILLMGLPYEAMIYERVRSVVPNVHQVYLTPGGCGWLHARVSIEKQSEGDGKNAILAAFSAHPSLKHVIVVDSDIDAYSDREVEWALATRFQAGRGLVVIEHARGSSLDPSSDQENLLTSKMGLDATAPVKKPREKFERAKIPFKDR
jgi:UbiD family decarboxylase